MEHHSTMKRLSVVLAVLFGLLIGFRAFPDSNSGSSIGIQNGGSSIGAAAVLNCSTNMTCAVSGGIVSISASSSAGSAFNTITSGTNSTAAMVVNTGASLSATGTGTILGCTQDVSNNLTCGGSLAAGTGSTSGKLNLPGKTSHAVSAITVDDSNTATTVKLPNDVTAGLYLPTTTGATPAAGCAQFNGTSTEITSTGVGCPAGSGGGATVGTFASLPGESDGATYVTSDSVYTFYGSGGVWIPFIPSQVPGRAFLPQSTGWSFVNQNGTSVSTTRGGIDLTAPANAANSISFYGRTAISPPWTVDAMTFISMQGQASNPEVGILMYESGTGKFLEYTLQGGTGNLAILQGATLSTGASATVAQFLNLGTAGGGAGYHWFQFSYDNSAHTVTFRFSGNGRDWIVLASATVTTYFTTAPDTYGIHINARNGTYNAANWLVSWNERNAAQ